MGRWCALVNEKLEWFAREKVEVKARARASEIQRDPALNLDVLALTLLCVGIGIGIARWIARFKLLYKVRGKALWKVLVNTLDEVIHFRLVIDEFWM